MFNDTTHQEIELAMQQAWKASILYRNFSLKQRAAFLLAIAEALLSNESSLLTAAMAETNLPEARLRSELSRTIFQLKNYAAFCESGQWMDIRIDTAAERNPPKPDLRKMMVPLGPVVVFGASNFPFAYSTAGGDTACAFAAGNPVIVKAHPAHANTSELVAALIIKTAGENKLPEGIFTHLHGSGPAVGESLVKHPYTKAVGFTGSFAGGKQLFDWGNQREEPIPVFAEMSSVNPVFILPQKMKRDAKEIAQMYAASISLSVGQFCTNPGILVVMDNEDLPAFQKTLLDELGKVPEAKMLHQRIAKNYEEKKIKAITQKEVSVILGNAGDHLSPLSVTPFITTTAAKNFTSNPVLQEEVFGPYSIIVRCKTMKEMTNVAQHIKGQLTSTIIATNEEIESHPNFVDAVRNLCGRFIFNGVPTGVDVCLSMQHGGPYPSTTDSRFTSVGGDGIKRFARPIAYQSWPNHLLPEELKNENPLGLWRTVNNQLTNEALNVIA